ncbi:MAG: hypothetical protein JNK82_05770 [Myxococcaceae bacterium]|nr:hypothetical protein [Myxococcaceae bacterium]
MAHVDGSVEAPPDRVEHRCSGCGAHLSFGIKELASAVIEEQTEELLGSISQLLRGNAKLN